MTEGTLNAERLLELYERVADAPDAVHRLRRFVLDLAMRGQLIKQDPNDEPVSDLLERIRAEKARMTEAGEIRKKAASDPNMVEPPHDLPSSWRWVPLGSILLYDAGAKRNSESLDPSRWLLDLEDIEKESGRLLARWTATDRRSKSTKSEFQIGDILYCKLRPYLNKVMVAHEPGYSTTEIVSLRPFVTLCSEYCALALRRPDFVAYVTRLGQGTKMPRLRSEDAVVSPFPLPPIAEQHRIVAKVEELMALLDRLQETQTAAEATRDRLTTASLARLTAPEATPEEFPVHARFALDTLPALTTRADQIETLRRSILNLAVRGMLVAQEPQEHVAERFSDRVPYDWLPPTWRTLNFGKYCNIQGGNQPPKSHFVDEPRPGYVRLFQIRDLGRNPAPVYIPAGSTNRFCKNGEILIGRYGASVGKIFWAQEGAYNVALTKFVWPEDAFLAEFAFVLLKSDLFQDRLSGASRSAQAGFNKGDLRNIDFPLPPLAEQHRIVAKVDETLMLCDRLETSLNQSKIIKQRLLESLLRKALPSEERNKEAA